LEFLWFFNAFFDDCFKSFFPRFFEFLWFFNAFLMIVLKAFFLEFLDLDLSFCI
jgi:hypothetical protein